LKNTWDYLDLESNSRLDVEKANLCLMVDVGDEVQSKFNHSSFETSLDLSYSSFDEDELLIKIFLIVATRSLRSSKL